MLKKTAEKLWKDYHFLTKEMVKFLEQKDMELFYSLMNQRECLQGMISEAIDDGFKASEEGQNLLVEVQQDNQLILHTLQFQINTGKRQHQVAEAYNATSHNLISHMDWKK